jgi:hypothetical protein
MAGTVKLDVSKLNQLIASIPGNAEKVTAEAAMLIEQRAKMNIQTWPLIDTGALLNSIQAEKIKRGRWVVHDGVEYGIYWELGHRNIFLRRYVRKPFFLPAVKYVESKFSQMIAQGLFK